MDKYQPGACGNNHCKEEMEKTSFTDQCKPTVNDGGQDRKSPTCIMNTQCYFCDFCDNTSIHGFKFLGEHNRYFIEKVWWLLVVSGALCGSAFLICKTYEKWTTSPVVVTFATTETPIRKIPFPAVTICPEHKARRSVLNYTDVFVKRFNGIKTTPEENEYFDLFTLTCKTFDDLIVNAGIGTTITKQALNKFLDAFVGVKAEDCRWIGATKPCGDILSTTITAEGICLTFNMFDLEDVYVDPEDYIESRVSAKHSKVRKWSLEDGYVNDVDLNVFPRRTILAGANAGFEINLNVDDKELDYVCSELQGFKVTLHNPAEEPNMNKHFRVPLNQAVLVGIRPRMITTSEEIRTYSPQNRQCYLPGEKVLDTYKIYTQQNCLMECLTNYTVQKCGCAAFYMSYKGDAKICGFASKSCVNKVKVEFLVNDISEKKENGIGEQCGCLPACTSLEFDCETSQTEYEWKKTTRAILDMQELRANNERFHQSKLIVYYKEMRFMTSERHELYGTVDFLANCGGLLGLFCGFSFTSLMEILYYLTLRLVCNLKKSGRRVWSGAPELVKEDHRSEPNELSKLFY